MKFTKEEISLCKQIAKKHRKEIGEGDWYININLGNISFLCQHGSVLNLNEAVPIWTISDCLEFLRERGWMPYEMFWIGDKKRHPIEKARIAIEYIKPKPKMKKKNKYRELESTTLLEACLKTVLAVLKEKK